jgi:nucleoside-diphosphate-sugar epimerase
VRVLVVGGSGYVGSLLVPALAARHEVRVLDLREPSVPCDYHPGDATDPAALTAVLDGVDALVHCAMADTADPAASFDVNVKSVHLALRAAHEAGVPHAVHISSMSVYRDIAGRRIDDESVPADATDLYGLTKRLGEAVCAAAAREWGLSINVLRLTWPTPDDLWPMWGGDDPPLRLATPSGVSIDATAGSDLARAVLSAMEHRDGFHVFTVSGDRSAGLWSTAKARTVLGWEPTFGIDT